MEAVVDPGALGFWLFLAAVVVSGKWFDSRKRESQQETLRRMVESGQKVDPAIIDKLLASGRKGDSRGYQELKIAGIITMFVAAGLTVFGYFLERTRGGIFDVMLGVALLVGVIGDGIYVAGKVSERWYNERQG